MSESESPQSEKTGTANYVNKNCWLAKTLNYSPARRCRYCQLKFNECPFFQYLIISLVIIIFSFVLSFLLEGKILKSIFAAVFISVLVYGYFFNKSTEKIIESNFAQRKAREELEEAKRFLELKVKERTKELRELAKNLDEQVKERTQALEEKTRELEESRKALLNILEDTEEARRRAEEERNKTQTIINTFVDGLLVFDAKNKLILINPKAEEFLEIKESEILGKSTEELKKNPQIKSLIEIIGEKIKDVFREELPISEDLILEVTTSSVLAGKRKIATLVILHDITREKRIEKMKSEFVSVAAHQLRTPLSIIKWSLSLLLEADSGEISPDQKDLINKAYLTNERMVKLVNDLLNVARIEEGRFVYQPKIVEFDELIKQIFDSLKELAQRKGLSFELKIEKSKKPKVVKVDVEKMALAIKNLIENAITYTDPGGKVLVKLKRKNGQVEFSVKDTGVGIPKSQQERVFSKFFRGSNVVRMETEGTGLGLFITKNIIEAHDGKIWFRSKEGEGTTFFFTLPTIV
jgi:PAS domain S-box-containing protein